MDHIRIIGQNPLCGEIPISGAKNAALPLMAACLLSADRLQLQNIPYLADIASMANLLASMGVGVHIDGHRPGLYAGQSLSLEAATITSPRADYELVRKMRASVLVLGPLLARFGKAVVSLPGGCAIGARPVDLHLMAMRALGAEIDLSDGYIYATAPSGLRGGKIDFPIVSVGATENALMAATLARGTTTIHNAAIEPEIVDLAECLNKMGARISGIGTATMTVEGVTSLASATHQICPDRIEAGTYAIAAMICGGELFLRHARAEHLGRLMEKLTAMGGKIEIKPDGIMVSRHQARLTPVDVVTEPFPGFPTDLQAQMMSLLVVADGPSEITETIFENRFMHAPELMRMGAQISIHGAKAVIDGGHAIKGAPVMATDLRASVSLILAGLAAKGETTVSRIYHLDRGYERLEEKLAAVGANIERVRA